MLAIRQKLKTKKKEKQSKRKESKRKKLIANENYYYEKNNVSFNAYKAHYRVSYMILLWLVKTIEKY